MGSYAGASDWDELPSRSSYAAFRPTPQPGSRARTQQPAESAPAPTPDTEAEDGVTIAETGRAKPRLNAIFAFDTTGSMTPWVVNTQDKMKYLATGLLKLLDMEIELIGVGDHVDGRNMLQITPFSGDLEALQQSIDAFVPTDGGDTPEAFECLFRVLNSVDYPVPTVLIIVTDSIPHDMDEYEGDDDGCPFGVDWQAELEDLNRKLAKVYLITCATDPDILELQRQMVGANGLLQLADMHRLANLVMALCMREVGELEYFVGILEAQRGPIRRAEILSLLGEG